MTESKQRPTPAQNDDPDVPRCDRCGRALGRVFYTHYRTLESEPETLCHDCVVRIQEGKQHARD